MAGYNQELIELSYDNVLTKEDIHLYYMNFKIHNTTDETLKNYHVEIKMPKRVVAFPEKLPNYNARKSTRKTAFFSIKGNQEILPNESLDLGVIPYFVNNDTYHDFAWNLSTMVEMTLYHNGWDAAGIIEPFDRYMITRKWFF